MKNGDKQNGITLVALVITIIILLILAGISINALTGTGLFEKANLAKQISKEKEEAERIKIEEYSNEVGKYIDGDRNNITKNVLWKKTENITQNEIHWTESIENYQYLIIQCYYNDVDNYDKHGGIRNFLVDVELVKAKGYITENFSDANSHVNCCDYDSYYMYLAFTSDKSLTVAGNKGRSLNNINRIVGIK